MDDGAMQFWFTSMGKYFGLFFFIIQLFKITSVEAFFRTCNVSLQTVKNVAGCPINETLYEIAARQKNCSSLPVDSSSCVSFEYHCVLREDLKTAIEVCAPSLNIIGHSCAMFSNKHKSIMRVDNMACGNGTEGCPFSYNSTTSFRYEQCIPTESQSYSTEATQRSSNSKTKEDMRQSSNEQKLINILVPLGVAALVIVGVLLFCFIRRNKRRQGKLHNIEQKIEMAERNVQENVENNLQPIQLREGNDAENYDIQRDGEQPEQEPLIPNNETKFVKRQDEQQVEMKSINLDAFPASSNKYPAYKLVKTRDKSFEACNNSMKMRAEEFARDGFYYEGYERATTCFNCGRTKNDWTSQDDIHSVHLQMNGECKFVNYLQSNHFNVD